MSQKIHSKNGKKKLQQGENQASEKRGKGEPKR